MCRAGVDDEGSADFRLGLGAYALVGASRVAPKAGNESPLCLVFVRVRLAGDASKK